MHARKDDFAHVRKPDVRLMRVAARIVLCLTASPLLAATNLLVRADFPSDGLGGLPDWTPVFGAEEGRSFTREPGAGPHGETALRIDFRKKNYLAQRWIRLAAGEPYVARAWVRTKNLPKSHSYALSAWNRGWFKTFVNKPFPADTAGRLYGIMKK